MCILRMRLPSDGSNPIKAQEGGGRRRGKWKLKNERQNGKGRQRRDYVRDLQVTKQTQWKQEEATWRRATMLRLRTRPAKGENEGSQTRRTSAKVTTDGSVHLTHATSKRQIPSIGSKGKRRERGEGKGKESKRPAAGLEVLGKRTWGGQRKGAKARVGGGRKAWEPPST